MQKKNVVVLGAGLVGGAIAADLADHFNVTAVDADPRALARLKKKNGIKTVRADLSKAPVLRSAAAGADIVVGALPGSMGYRMLKTLAQEKKDIVDISFFAEDPFPLDELFRENGITVITDCGVAPGMGNIILGHHNSTMVVDSYECYVGGLPVEREWPWEYRAVFSPMDVIEEYTRPARYVENGHLVEREALSDPQLVYFKGIGSLEAWNSDGLRTLIKTIQVPNMIEKTLRYPGCIEYLRVLRESGFFSQDEVDVKGVKIRPVDLTASLLFPKWELKPGEEDFTVMRIIVTGTRFPGENRESRLSGENDPDVASSAAGDRVLVSGKMPPVTGEPVPVEGRIKYTWELLDRYEGSTGTLSMARTTGYTCTAAVHLLARGMFTRKGLCPPEYLGEDGENFRFIMKYLGERGVRYRLEQS
jgi:lysine 6-dehydrogenase